MTFAQCVDRLQPSGTLRMAKKADDLIAQGKDIIKFSLGQPDFRTPQHIIDAAKQALDDGYTGYTPSSGYLDLKEAIAEKSRNENKIPSTHDTVLVTVAKHGVLSSVMACVDKGSEVIIPDPGWVSYDAMVRLAGGRSVPARVDMDTDFRLKPDDLNELVTDRTSMIILNSPSNPTGGVSTLDDLKGIADIARDKDLIVMSDEIYEKVLYEGTHHSIASLDGMFDRTYTVNGFSKAYAMTGWRIGWVTASKDLLHPLQLMQQQSITCVTSFVQKAAIAALKGPSGPVEDMVSSFRERRDSIVKRLNAIDGFTVKLPKGAFYVFPGYDFEIPSREFAEDLLDYGIAVTPGIEFGNFGEHHIRFSYAASSEKILEGMDRLEYAVQDMDLDLRGE